MISSFGDGFLSHYSNWLGFSFSSSGLIKHFWSIILFDGAVLFNADLWELLSFRKSLFLFFPPQWLTYLHTSATLSTRTGRYRHRSCPHLSGTKIRASSPPILMQREAERLFMRSRPYLNGLRLAWITITSLHLLSTFNPFPWNTLSAKLEENLSF